MAKDINIQASSAVCEHQVPLQCQVQMSYLAILSYLHL